MIIKLIIFFLTISLSATAARQAIVVKEKTILYADPTLESPIGYISKGKKILVGNKNYKSDKITTVIVSGKIAYIKTLDILIKSELMKEDFAKQKQKDYLNKNSVDNTKEDFYYIFSTSYQLPFNFLGHFQAAANLNITNFSPFSLVIDLERYSSLTRLYWGLGLNYFSLNGNTITYRSLIGNIKVGWQLFKSDLLNINMTAGFNFSGDYRVEFTNVQKNKGQLLGANFETYAHFLPKHQWSIKAGAGITQNMVFAIKNIKIPLKTDRVSETTYGSFYLFIGISKYF